MRAWIADASAWTPEGGVLSAEDGLGSMSRFSRTCAAVIERLLVPDGDALVIVGTSTAPSSSPARIVDELRERWPGSELELVVAGSRTVPLSGLDALVSVGCEKTVVWAVVDLKPGAELAAAIRLSSAPTHTALEIRPTDEVSPPVAAHLNSCAAVLSLVDTVAPKSVSIKVDSWSLTVTPDA